MGDMSKRLHLSCPRCNAFVPAGAGHSCVEYGPSEPLTYPREWKARAEAAEAKVAALEARLAELGPVVEAAERWSAADVAHGFAPSGTIAEQEQSTREMCAAEYDLREAVCALRVARAKREKGGAA